VRAVDEGRPVAQVAQELQVSERWVYKLLKQRRAGKGLEPQYAGHCGRPRKFSADHERYLLQDVRHFPDATLEERVERLQLPVKAVQTWRWLRRLGLTHKKRAWWPVSGYART
jgi:transposase